MEKKADKNTYTAFTGSGSRRSMQTGADLRSIYDSGKGSIFTNGAPPSPSGKAKGLDKQISEGVDFFGVGRNLRGSDGQSLGQQTILVAGQGKKTGSKGKYDMIAGFVTKKKSMDVSDFGTDLPKTVSSSWYTAGLEADVKDLKYGTSGSISAFSSQATSTRQGGARGASDGSARSGGGY